jgi:uncharacterized LabA/DUF88 family protein
MRVVAFIDGFNLYHAIDDLRKHHLKWVDLRQVCEVFSPPPDMDLLEVYYFSAFATWRPASYKRHRDYVAALQVYGVTPVLGRFKEKDRRCFACGNAWTDHEEKETDVNLAVYLLDLAYRNAFDRALVVSGDSDLVPAVRMVRERFPEKDFRIIAPVGRGFSMDLLKVAGGKKSGRRLRESHLESALLSREVRGSDGRSIISRPAEYDPPT